MQRIALAIFILFLTQSALAAKFALVIGGKANPGVKHDIGRSLGPVAFGLSQRGYKTTLLFGDGGPAPKGFGTESATLSADYAATNQLHSIDGPATKQTIHDAFTRIGQQAKTGDNVEIVLHAHGLCDPNEKKFCRGQIVIFDERGGRADVYDDEIVAEVAKLDAKGIRVNFIFATCRSGTVAEQVEKLKNACVFMSASENEKGFFCADPTTYGKPNYGAEPAVASFDILAYRYYERALPRILQIPYYKNDPCLHASQRASVAREIDFTNLSTAFWGARVADESEGAPYLSKETDFHWQKSGSLTDYLQAGSTNPIVISDAMCRFDELTRIAGSVNDPLVQSMRNGMRLFITAYNTDRGTEKVILDKLSKFTVEARATDPEYRRLVIVLARVRGRINKTYPKIVKLERAIVDVTIGRRQRRANAGNPNCKRALE